VTSVGVLGPVVAWGPDGAPLPLGGPRHRELLARLVVARGRVVPLGTLVDDLWDGAPPTGAVGAVRTFVAALRRGLEPGRTPRTAPRLLVTDGPGYALRLPADGVDAWRVERDVAAAPGLPAVEALAVLEGVLGSWRGPVLAGVGDRPWAAPDRARWAELRSTAVERAAAALLALDRAADAVPLLEAHTTTEPWREEAWRLLALALYRGDRSPDALAVLRRARTRLADELGLDPGPQLADLETAVLRRDPALDRLSAGDPQEVFTAAARSWTGPGPGARSRLHSTVALLRGLAVSGAGGLTAAQDQRLATVAAAEQLGDPVLTARVLGGFDVPSVWPRSDDGARSAQLADAAERTLARLPAPTPRPVRARLLVALAVELRGTAGPRGPAVAGEAEALARGSGDPALLAAALDAVYLHACSPAGRAAERDAVGAELVDLATRHGLPDALVVGHLVRVQARTALGDLAGAGGHATELDGLAAEHERPLVTLFTDGWRALRAVLDGAAEEVLVAALRRFDDGGMPGVATGLVPLALTCLRVARDLPAGAVADAGPYEPWVRPHRLLAAGRTEAAAEAVRALPDPPPGLLLEALWVLAARAALAVGDGPLGDRAAVALAPAAGELAAGSGLLTAGPVDDVLRALGR
jgi:DNA-binding SARP family transcriptional activator